MLELKDKVKQKEIISFNKLVGDPLLWDIWNYISKILKRSFHEGIKVNNMMEFFLLSMVLSVILATGIIKAVRKDQGKSKLIGNVLTFFYYFEVFKCVSKKKKLKLLSFLLEL